MSRRANAPARKLAPAPRRAARAPRPLEVRLSYAAKDDPGAIAVIDALLDELLPAKFRVR